MNLNNTIRLMYAEAAGSQATVADSKRAESQTKRLLDKKQSKLDSLRRSVTPWPEDKRGVNANEDDLDTENFEKRMRKGTKARPGIHTGPGAVPIQDVTGSQKVKAVRAYIVKQGSQHCVKSESGKNLGCGPSATWAKKRLQQVEYFKRKKG